MIRNVNYAEKLAFSGATSHPLGPPRGHHQDGLINHGGRLLPLTVQASRTCWNNRELFERPPADLVCPPGDSDPRPVAASKEERVHPAPADDDQARVRPHAGHGWGRCG